MQISPVSLPRVHSGQKTFAAFQKTGCRKPHGVDRRTKETNIYMKMAEASVSGTRRGRAIQAELQSMGLI